MVSFEQKTEDSLRQDGKNLAVKKTYKQIKLTYII